MSEQIECVYHYCSIDTFLNIIRGASFWLSDVLKMNDYKECVWIRDRVKSETEKRLARLDPKLLDKWKTGYQLNPSIGSMGSILYTACFSQNADSLSQWRGYADDGKGIAIGVSKKALDAINDKIPYGPLFDKVIYAEEEQERFIDQIAIDNLDAMTHKGVGHVALELNSNYLMKFPLYKNPSFEEEKEWRIVYHNRPENPGIKRDIGGFVFSGGKYRCTDSRIISYVEMDFSNLKQEIIKEIWIGPKAKVSARDIVGVLHMYGYYDLSAGYSSNEPISIYFSGSSYR